MIYTAVSVIEVILFSRASSLVLPKDESQTFSTWKMNKGISMLK